MIVENSTAGDMPNLEVPENEKTAKWYAQVLRYYSTFYNRPYASWGSTKDDTVYGYSPVEQMRLWFFYYLGRQPNLNFNHFFDSGTGTSVQNTWINGQKVSQLIKRMEGNTNSLLSDIELSARALSPEAKGRRTQMLEDALMEYDNAPLFQELEQFGVKPTQIVPPKFQQSREDIARFMQYDFYETGEYYAQEIANTIYNKNNGKEEYKSAFRHAVVGGICGINTYVDNGFVKFNYIPSWNCIWDNRHEDDFNRKARFVGFIERLTPSEIIQRYKKGKVDHGLSEEEINEIKNFAKTDSTQQIAELETSPTFKWYSTGINKQSDTGEITVVHMYWFCLRDTRHKKLKDSYGTDTIVKLNDKKKKDSKEAGDYYVMDVCKATLIGNRWLVDYGYCNNVIRDPFNQSDPMLPVRFFIPGMVMDQFRSYVARLHEIQDQMDALRFKMMEMVARDIGKNYIVNGNKLGLVRPKDMFTDFKSMGIHVTTGTDGEVDSLASTQRQVELVDLTLDPNVNRYVELMNYFESTMEEIVAIPKVALGQDTRAGLGVQKNAIINSSLSNANLYDGFIKFIEMNLQYAVNVQKNIYCLEDNEDAEFVIGERGMRYLKETKDFLFENFGILISLKDIITPEKRQELWQLAFNLSQNGLIDMKDAIKIQTETNINKLENYFDFALDKKRREAEAAQAAQAQQAQALQAQKNQGVLANTALKEDAAGDRNALDNKTKLMTEAANLESQANQAQ